MLDIHNPCQRCREKTAAPMEPSRCEFIIGGLVRVYYLCGSCRVVVATMVEHCITENAPPVFVRHDRPDSEEKGP